jgi:hypothetical protein
MGTSEWLAMIDEVPVIEWELVSCEAEWPHWQT